MYNDVSTTPGLVKAFGVSQKIAKGLKPGTLISFKCAFLLDTDTVCLS